ncbi:hypothetical protein I204_01788 [Kwoniella mangroviensis CBS 8886]|nr:hypothetical protein I204_01788 [Kwoniella mangroviensis CBS 8886]
MSSIIDSLSSTVSTLYQTLSNATSSREISVDDDTQTSIRRLKTDPTYSHWGTENYKMLDNLSQPTIELPIIEEDGRKRLEMLRAELDKSIDTADQIRAVRCKARKVDYERVKVLVQSVLENHGQAVGPVRHLNIRSTDTTTMFIPRSTHIRTQTHTRCVTSLQNPVKRSSSPFDDGLPLPALIAIPVFGVVIFLMISFFVYRCVRYGRIKHAFNKQNTIPKIDLNQQPSRGFDIDEHTITPFPSQPSNPSNNYLTLGPGNQAHRSPLSSLTLQPMIESHLPMRQHQHNHSRTPSQEALLRHNAENDGGDVPPPAYAQLSLHGQVQQR